MKTRGMTHIHLVVSELERSVRFYQNAFGVLGANQLKQPIKPPELTPRSRFVSAVRCLVKRIGDPRDLLHSSLEACELRGINGGRVFEE